jgi:hypothetical protein
MSAFNELPCATVAEEVRTRFRETRAGLAVYWVAVKSSRGDYAQQLQAMLHDHPVGVVVLRSRGLFENANSVMADIATLVSEAQSTLQQAFAVHADSRRWGVVVVARTPMTIGQSSSPVELPDWFPDLGGTEVHSSIEDITWLSLATLDDADLALSALHRSLYDVEGALLRRLMQVGNTSPGSQAALFGAIGKNDEANLTDSLKLARQEHRQVPNPNSYRPSARHDRAIVARLWSQAAVTKPLYYANDLAKPLASALKLDQQLLAKVDLPESLFAVLGAPGQQGPPPSKAQRFADNLLWCVVTSFRLLTASHHADEHGRFPYPLLYSVSRELRSTLGAYEQALNLHE